MGFTGTGDAEILKVNQLIASVRKEVEKPFQEKLGRAKQLVKMWGRARVPPVCVSCSFGKDSVVVLWLALQENSEIPVIFNNTGVEYAETLALKEKLKQTWNLNLIETKPLLSFWQVMDKTQKTKAIQDDGKKHSNQCCYALKHAPFHKIVQQYGFTHTFTGLTALESRHRMFTACEYGQEYYSKKDGLWKIHPILYWTPSEVWQFIRENHLPENQAYKKYGLDRIGCVPCTSHRKWREQLARVNPAMYKLIQERYFHQRLLEKELSA